MASVNKAILIGNLGADPELRYTAGGRAVANFRMATTRNWTTKDGEKKEETEWHRIVAWDKLAEIIGEYLKKGSPVYVEGRIQTKSWEDQNGAKRWSTEIVALEMKMLGQRQGAGSEAREVASNAPPPPDDMPSTFEADDDLPF